MALLRAGYSTVSNNYSPFQYLPSYNFARKKVLTQTFIFNNVKQHKASIFQGILPSLHTNLLLLYYCIVRMRPEARQQLPPLLLAGYPDESSVPLSQLFHNIAPSALNKTVLFRCPLHFYSNF